jgi:GMP synthase PP-ATPase subunit
MQMSEIVRKAGEIAKPYNLKAEMLEGINSVGVVGDTRSYDPVIVLIGQFPGYEVLAKISQEITNTLAISRVTFQIGARSDS